MREGLPLSRFVEFSDGFPDGDLDWTVVDATGVPVTNGSVTPAEGAVSSVITVPADQNLIAGDEIFEHRELQVVWTVNGEAKVETFRYRLEAFLPFGLHEDGVRGLLGLERHELKDEAIDLVSAYGRFEEYVGAAQLLAAEAVGGHTALTIKKGIEAFAARTIVPTLQITLAQKESSGTNQFARGDIDWDRLIATLDDYVNEAAEIVNPNIDPTGDYTTLLLVAVRPDPVTGGQ